MQRKRVTHMIRDQQSTLLTGRGQMPQRIKSTRVTPIAKQPHQEGEKQRRMGGSPRRLLIRQCLPQTPHCRAPPALRPSSCKSACETRASQLKKHNAALPTSGQRDWSSKISCPAGLGQLPQRIKHTLAKSIAKHRTHPIGGSPLHHCMSKPSSP